MQKQKSKITYISAANCPRVANIILNLCIDMTVVPSGQIQELSNMYKKNITETLEILEKNI